MEQPAEYLIKIVPAVKPEEGHHKDYTASDPGGGKGCANSAPGGCLASRRRLPGKANGRLTFVASTAQRLDGFNTVSSGFHIAPPRTRRGRHLFGPFSRSRFIFVRTLVRRSGSIERGRLEGPKSRESQRAHGTVSPVSVFVVWMSPGPQPGQRTCSHQGG